MRGIKISKIETISLLVFVICFGQVQEFIKMQPPLEHLIDGRLYIEGNFPPKVGEIFQVVYRINIKETSNWLRSESYRTKDYNAIIRGVPEEAIEFIGENKFFFSGLTPGTIKEFRTRCRIKKPARWILLDGDILLANHGPVATSGAMNFYLLDSVSGQYGTKAEYEKQLRKQAEWWYDYVAGEFTSEPLAPTSAAVNREIIAQIKQIEPDLTDWEALYLHSDGIQALMGGMGTQKTTWEDRWRFLLEQGWLEKQRAGKEVKEKWLKELIGKYKGKPLIKEQGLNLNRVTENKFL